MSRSEDDTRHRCPHCRHQNLAAAMFCSCCGGGLGTPADDPMLRSVTRLTPLMRAWRKLSTQMTRREVRRLLGEPARIELSGPPGQVAAVETWIYAWKAADAPQNQAIGSLVISVAESRVLSWVEPDWDTINKAAGH